MTNSRVKNAPLNAFIFHQKKKKNPNKQTNILANVKKNGHTLIIKRLMSHVLVGASRVKHVALCFTFHSKKKCYEELVNNQ